MGVSVNKILAFVASFAVAGSLSLVGYVGNEIWTGIKDSREADRAEAKAARAEVAAALAKIGDTLSDVKQIIAVQRASDTHQDERIRSIAAELAAVQRECSARWSKSR